MAVRVVNGSTYTEDGWPLVDQAGCTWAAIPGTTVTIQVQIGVPATALTMWLGDWNAYVEPLEDPTTACWTQGNSVLGGYGENDGSNHLGGTAADADWEKHPMGPHAPDDPAAGFTVAQVDTINEMKAYFTFTAKDGTVIQIVWWANDWDSPHDSMHSQLGYGTFQYRDEVAAWLAAHIRPDGLSTFRRGAMPQQDSGVPILAAAVGCSLAHAADILPEVRAGLIGSHCNTVNRIAMWLAEEGEESAGFTATVEIGNIDGTTYQGRTWEQITGASNYAAFSKWAYDNGIEGVTSPTYFVDNPAALGDPRYESVGATWYWTVARPQINGLADAGDVEGVTRAINGGLNGIDARVARWNLALAQGDSLLTLLVDEDDWMTNPQVVQMIADIHRETVDQHGPSRSFMAVDGTLIDTPLGINWNTDGNAWTLVLTEAYRLGVPLAVATVEYIAANGVYPDSYASADANKWLADFGQAYCKGLVAEKATPVKAAKKSTK